MKGKHPYGKLGGTALGAVSKVHQMQGLPQASRPRRADLEYYLIIIDLLPSGKGRVRSVTKYPTP